MTWGAVAVAGATVVSGYMASESASDASKAAGQASAESLAFERQKYENWRATYGGIEENLAEYYGSLTPDYFEAQGLEAFEQERTRELENVRSTLAQRGIQDSGIALATELGMAQTAATERARIRATAPSLAAEEQRSFLQVGLGQAPGESYSRALAEQASLKGEQAMVAEQAAGKAIGSAITTTGTALADYFNRPEGT